MKKNICTFICVPMATLFIAGTIVSCNKEVVPPVKEIVYVQTKDTILEKQYADKIKELENKCYLLQDSLNVVKNNFNVVKNDLNNTRDSLKEERFVSNYKFARIKYYTDIAAKGNNIKFLRGWIYRVLKEK